jgi:hypothetical protein
MTEESKPAKLPPHEAVHVIERDVLDLAIEPGRALALRLFGPSRINPAPGDERPADQ